MGFGCIESTYCCHRSILSRSTPVADRLAYLRMIIHHRCLDCGLEIQPGDIVMNRSDAVHRSGIRMHQRQLAAPATFISCTKPAAARGRMPAIELAGLGAAEPLQRRHGHSEDWQDARHRDGIGATGSDGAAAPFRISHASPVEPGTR